MKITSKNYSKKTIAKILNSPTPRVLLNVCTHGNEKVGLKVSNYFSRLQISNGTLVINIANKKAVKANKRFIDADLNRVFPGKQNGNYEENLAYKMKPFVKIFDFVIDVHSTRTGVNSAIILNSFDKRVIPIISAISPKYVLIMNATKANSLISVAKQSIAFEYGKDKDLKTYVGTINGIKNILGYFKMMKLVNKKTGSINKTDYFEAYESVQKPEGFIVSDKITNFKLIRKGQLIGSNPHNGLIIHADEDFYPILFGNNTYKTIFGFKARKLDV